MSTPNVLILRAPGTNCDAETAFAFERAGAKTETLHINRLLEKPVAVPAVPNPLRSRRIQLRRRPGRRPNPRQPDPAPPGRRACPLQGRRQADAGHLQRVPGVDEIARAAGPRRREGPGRHADAERLRAVPGPLGAARSAWRASAFFWRASSGCICRWPMPKGSSSPATRRRCGNWTPPANSCCDTSPADNPNGAQAARGGRVRRDRPRVGPDAASRASHRPDAASPLDPRRSRPRGRRAASVRQRGGVFRVDDSLKGQRLPTLQPVEIPSASRPDQGESGLCTTNRDFRTMGFARGTPSASGTSCRSKSITPDRAFGVAARAIGARLLDRCDSCGR